MKAKAAVIPLTTLIKKKTIFVHDLDQDLQESACLSLGKIGDRSAVPDLIKALKLTSPILMLRNKSPKVRAAAAYALSHFPSDEVRKVLSQAASDMAPDVRSAVNLAMYNLDKSIPKKGEKLLGEQKEAGA